MREQLEALEKQHNRIDSLLIAELRRVLSHDGSDFDIPTDYATYEEQMKENQRKADELAKKPKAKYIDAADVAKLVRAKLKANFPGQKFSVKTSKYSMGASIDVAWENGPTTKEVDKVVSVYKGSTFDAMIDLKSYVDTTDPDTGELVHYGSDHVFCQRSLSKDCQEIVWGKVCKKWGYDPNKAQHVQSKYDGSWHYTFTYENGTDYQREYNIIASETSFYQQVTPKETKPESNGVTIGEYKGHATISLPCGSKDFTFGVSKAQAILDNIEAIKQFVKDNQ